MRNPRRLADLAVLLPLGAVLLFTPPYVGLFDSGGTLLGLPVQHVYIFGAWGFGIVLTAVVARRLAALDDEAGPPPGETGDSDGAPDDHPGRDGA